MSQDLLSLTSPNARSAPTGMRYRCLSQYSYIGLRFLRYKCSPWLTLAIVPVKLLCASSERRTHEQIRYLRALYQIDFVVLYKFVNDLLW